MLQLIPQGRQMWLDDRVKRAVLRPIALTAAAAMMGGFFILDDPIFSGLAVSLIFGLLVSTVLTLLVIPVVYYHYHWRAAGARTDLGRPDMRLDVARV